MRTEKLLCHIPYFGIFYSLKCGKLKGMQAKQINRFIFYHFGTTILYLVLFVALIAKTKHHDKQPIQKTKENVQVSTENYLPILPRTGNHFQTTKTDAACQQMKSCNK